MQTAFIRRSAQWIAAGAGIAASAYAAYAAVTWLRYGKPPKASPDEADELLDRFMPDYDVVERHHTRVKAPAAITLAAAKEVDVLKGAIARALFTARALALGGAVDNRELPKPLMEQMQAIGWTVLAEVPGNEIVFGAVTRPWEAEPVFRGVAPSEFAAFNEPDYVPQTRTKFRGYWALASPGVALIRRMLVGPVKCEAERNARKAELAEPAAEFRALV